MASRTRSCSRRSAQLRRSRSKATGRPSPRRGSTLLIVMVLMGMLMLLGVLFYTFAAQERASAEYYSDGAKADLPAADVDALMNFALEQLIVGANPKYKNSALWGGRHSLIPNMLGNDVHPFNGLGVRVVRDGSGNLGVDLNNDGAADAGNVTDVYGQTVATNASGSSQAADLLDFVDMPAAHQGFERPLSQFPAPDVDYTYPDINNVFLSYDGYDPVNGYRVIIPSFHRPQLLRNGGSAVTNWNTSASMARRVMRAHPSHNYVPKSGQSGGATTSRYLSGAGGFPFTPPDSQQYPATTFYQGIWDPAGTHDATNNADRRPEFDVDNDGDGVYEGVWLDLDFPPQEQPDGSLYIPMVSFTVKDQDALFNLNVHGNLARVWANQVQLQSPFQYTPNANNPNDVFISKSNLGLTPSEINPLWGLNRDPSASGESAYPNAADDFFNHAGPTDWREIANREWAYLMLGRFQTTPSLTPGRFGEENVLYRAIDSGTGLPNSASAYQFAGFPGPGQAQIDDNGNRQGDWGGSSTGQVLPAFVHPLDFLGIGTLADTTAMTYSAKVPRIPVPVTNSARWPVYTGYSASTSVPIGYLSATGGIVGYMQDTLFNDLQETVYDQSERRDEDNLFGPDETRALNLSTADFANAVGGETRLTTLAPYNIAPASANYGSDRSSQHARQKFTTESWDRKNFSWVYDPARSWEYTADADQDGKMEFPPRFGVNPYVTTLPSDPFRPVLRTLLEMEYGDRAGGRRQLRFSVNHLLTDTNGNPNPVISAVPPKLQLDQRPLTSHADPSIIGNTPIPDAGINSYPQNGDFTRSGSLTQLQAAQLQEYWARRDRQLMARDIYVMLYAFGGLEGSTSDTNLNNPVNGPVYSPAQCRQMAQFAVNLVDSLDRDNVLTRFEYDIDLSTGWALDDDPYQVDASGDRAEVWGVERMDVTLSEALAVLTPGPAAMDYGFTQWRDDQPQPYFMYVELRNPGPFNVNFNSGAWQIEVVPHSAMGAPLSNDPNIRRLRLLQGNIPAGERFLIGSASVSPGGTPPSSIMKVNPNHSTSPLTTPAQFDMTPSTWIAPSQGRPLDLDLLDPPVGAPKVKDGTGTDASTNALLDSVTPNIAINNQLDVRLCRRAYPDRPAPTPGVAVEEQDNPWVYVDSLSIPEVKELTFAAGETDTQIQQKLRDNTKSFERREPFAGSAGEELYDPAAINANVSPYDTYVVNTLGADNCRFVAAAGPWRWQHHFDRDFASLSEILMLPVGNGSDPTYNMEVAPAIRGSVAHARSIGNGFSTLVDQVTNNRVGSAAAKFLVPRDPTTPTNELNHWHRVLELLEVPSRTHTGIAGFRDPLDYPRVPGKINPNMLRHPEVLAGLIDDPSIIQLDMSAPRTPPVMDQAGDVRANYWQNLLMSRDGKRVSGAAPSPDPVTGLYVPGTADSTPFRSSSYVDASANPDLESNILRPWTQDPSGASTDARRFFELGSTTQHNNSNMGLSPTAQPVDQQPVEPALRDRITGKILNNTTTRSNVFVVFVSIKKFKAFDNGSGVIQIGEAVRSTGNAIDDAQPEYRGYFVVDRSQPERGYDPSTGTFNFKDFILFRQIIQNLEEN